MESIGYKVVKDETLISLAFLGAAIIATCVTGSGHYIGWTLLGLFIWRLC